MYYSLSEIFAIGIGPSSSHTVGPMKAAKRFVDNLKEKVAEVENIKIYLYGSLALTGVGHGTLNAIVYGLMGYEADKLDLSQDYIGKLKAEQILKIDGKKEIPFVFETMYFILSKYNNGSPPKNLILISSF